MEVHLSRDGATTESRAAATRALNAMVDAQHLTAPDIMRRGGPSPNTVRKMLRGDDEHGIPMWQSISRALRCGDELLDILSGKTIPSPAYESPMERRLAQLIGEMSDLKEVVARIDQKIDVILRAQHHAED